MKRFLWVFVALTLSAPLWAGGQQENGASGEEAPMEISFGYWKEELFGGDFDRETDPLIQTIESRFNVRFVPKWVSWPDYKEKYKLWAAAGQLPDFFAMDLDKRTYLSWVDQGIIRPLPEDLSSYPEITKILTRDDTSHLSIDGKYYRIPRLHSVYPHVAQGVYVRKDWMESMGIEDPGNWDEFKAMVRRFIAEDPDGNGSSDTIGILPRRGDQWVHLRQSFSPALWGKYWIEEDGHWIPSFYSKQTVRAINEVAELYDEGLLYKDFLLIKDTVVGYEKFSYGNTGVLLAQGDPPRAQQLKDIWEKYNPDKPFSDHVKLINTYPFISDDGNRYNMNRPGYWADDFFRGDLEDEKLNKILEILEFLNIEEGINLWYRGIEGKDYTKEGDLFVDTRATGEDGEKLAISDIYPSSLFFGGMPYWGNDKIFFNLDEINYSRHDEDIVKATREYGIMLDEECSPYPTKLLISEFGNEYLASKGVNIDPRSYMEAALISDDPEGTWKKTLEMYRREGLDEYIDYVNKEIITRNLE